jgi:hypothetical protein
MERNDNERLPADLADVAQRLRDERPQASALELDRMKLRAQSQARRPARWRDPLMRSRLAITAMLVVGVLMSGTGAGLAVSGISGSGSAGTAQYGPTQSVLPTTESNVPTSEVLGTETTNTTTAAQTTRQLESGKSLPFTGYLAIPVLLLGLALLTIGIVMRRRFGRQLS